MGSCYSVHNNADTDMKLKFSLGSKTEKLVAPSPPAKDKEEPKNGSFRWTTSRSTTAFTDIGIKEETFFDSKAWLDSDCEDDFYSVNGDFTPSGGNTPVHHTFRTTIINKTSMNRISSLMPEPLPEKKKNLLELFQESIKGDQDGSNGKEKKDAKPTIQDVLPKSAESTPYISGANSGCSSKRVMSEDRRSIREKSAKSVQRCLPSLSSCRSFSERRGKASPAVEVNGKQTSIAI